MGKIEIRVLNSSKTFRIYCLLPISSHLSQNGKECHQIFSMKPMNAVVALEIPLLWN